VDPRPRGRPQRKGYGPNGQVAIRPPLPDASGHDGALVRSTLTPGLPCLAHSTVKHHLANARSKVGATTTAQLVWILGPRLPEPDGPARTDD
jgi:hypothetical protein